MGIIKVNYVSQLGPTASFGKGDCGMAVTCMVLDYHNHFLTVDDLGRLAGYSKGYTYTNSIDMTSVAQRFGVTLTWKRFSNFEFVDQELAEGKPVVMLVWYPYLSHRYSSSYTDNHFILVVGKDGDEYIYHDPFWPDNSGRGPNLRIHKTQLARAWKYIKSSYGSQNCIMVTTPSKVIKKPEIIPATPDPVKEPDVPKENYGLWYEIAKTARWSCEQAIRDLDEQNYQTAKDRLLFLVSSQEDSSLYKLEKFFGDKR